jgi:hypothetical protein
MAIDPYRRNTPQEAAAAQAVLEHPLVVQILDNHEMDHFNAALAAAPGETVMRDYHLNMVRAIRNLRSTLLFIEKDGEAAGRR